MKNFKIGDKLTRFPLIQGGMGVGISLGRLAGTVAKEGGIGIISTAGKRISTGIPKKPTSGLSCPR